MPVFPLTFLHFCPTPHPESTGCGFEKVTHDCDIERVKPDSEKKRGKVYGGGEGNGRQMRDVTVALTRRGGTLSSLGWWMVSSISIFFLLSFFLSFFVVACVLLLLLLFGCYWTRTHMHFIIHGREETAVPRRGVTLLACLLLFVLYRSPI